MRVITAVAACCSLATAFTAPRSFSTRTISTTSLFVETPSEELKKAAEVYEEPRMNPDRPELPELKGDFDWDEKFGGDDDWITENVPGKVVLNEIELATQVTALGKLEEKWKKERIEKEYEDGQILGWSDKAQTMNGRFAMFFLIVGLLTEYWTGVTIPGQIEEMLRVGGVIGFEG